MPTTPAESGMALPEEPVIFFKATSAIMGPDDTVEIPRNSVKTDWEVELGVVIGKHTQNTSRSRTRWTTWRAIASSTTCPSATFSCTARASGSRASPPTRSAPSAPGLVTRDEVPDPQNLPMYLEVNGHRYQDGSTKTMHFDVATVISHLSQFMSLQPGDVISTGTPPGVGMGQNPQTYLKPGDKIELGIEGLGVQRQKRRSQRVTRITGIRNEVLRFPTSDSLDGSDAMNPDPDYLAAYVVLETDQSHKGHDPTFTIGGQPLPEADGFINPLPQRGCAMTIPATGSKSRWKTVSSG